MSTQLGDVTKYLSFNGVINVSDTYVTDKTLLQEYGSISTSITSDQNLSFAVQFSNDSTTWYSSTQESIIANISEVITTVVIGKWCRYEVLNAGLVNANVNFTTYASTNPLAIQTQVQREGNTFPTFNVGNFSSNLYGDIRISNHRSLNEHKFIYSSIVGGNIRGPDTYVTNFDSGGLDPSTVLSIDSNMLSIKNIAASAANEFLCVVDTIPVVYLGGRTVEITFSFKSTLTGYETSEVDNMIVGFGNTGFFGPSIIDGVFLGYPSAPQPPDTIIDQLSLIYYNGGVETYIPISRWQEDRLDGTGPSGVTLNLNNLSIWRIRCGYHGATSIVLDYHLPYINQWQECHRIILENNINSPNFQNPSFNFIQRAQRTTSSVFDPLLGDVAITVSGAVLSIEEGTSFNGGGRLSSYSYSMPASIATGVGIVEVLSIQCSPTLNGKYNGSNILMRMVSGIAYNATGVESIFIIDQGGTFTAPVWTPLDSTTSAVNILTGGSYDIGSGFQRASFIVYPGSSGSFDMDKLGIYMGSGDTLTILIHSFTANSRVLSTFEYTQIV